MEYKYDNILVCMDLTEMDESLINYASFMNQTFDVKKITFVHVMDKYEIPEELADSFEDDQAPLDEILREDIEGKIDKFFDKSAGADYKIELLTGSTSEKIIDYARKNNVNLTLLGKKVGFIGKGGVTRDIIGLVSSSVLLVSETSRHSIEKILVRTNFGKPSVLAWNSAQFFAKKLNAKMEMHHVYKLPYHLFPEQTPQAVIKLKKQLQPYIEKQFDKFVAKNNLEKNINFSFSLDIKGDEAQSLYNYAIRKQVDLIVTGTRLKSKLANVILDSTSTKLASVDKNVPILIVKDTHHSVGFLKALFE